MTVLPIVIVNVRFNSQVLRKGSGRGGNKRTSRDHLDYSIIKVVQNTKKSPEDLR